MTDYWESSSSLTGRPTQERGWKCSEVSSIPSMKKTKEEKQKHMEEEEGG